MGLEIINIGCVKDSYLDLNRDNNLDEVADKLNDTAEQALRAASTQGFLMVSNHGFTIDEVSLLFKLSEYFFNLDSNVKEQYAISKDSCGYSSFGQENLDEANPNGKGDPKEAFNFSCINLNTGLPSQNLPEVFKSNSKVLQDSILKLQKIVNKLMVLLAIGLKISKNDGGYKWFLNHFDPNLSSGTTFRFLKYPSPKLVDSSQLIRAGAHTDYGGITLLFQQENQAGLEILTKLGNKDNSLEWNPVKFVPASEDDTKKGYAPPIIVNIADQLSFWTNGYLKSTVHRVKFPDELISSGRNRYSIVYFAHPNDITPLIPVPSPLIASIKNHGASQEIIKNGNPITAGEHLKRRLKSSYNWY